MSRLRATEPIRVLTPPHLAVLLCQAVIVLVFVWVFVVSLAQGGHAPVTDRALGLVGSILGAGMVAVGVRRWLGGHGLLMTVVNMALLVAVAFYVALAAVLLAGPALLVIGLVPIAICAIGMAGGMRPPTVA